MKSILVAVIFVVGSFSRSTTAFVPPSSFSSYKSSETCDATHQTQLHLSPAIKWAAGHMLGGLVGTPAVASAIATNGWYRKIDLPPWTPPDPLFGGIWSLMYVLMGVASSMVYYTIKHQTLTTTRSLTNVMTIWWIHYALNVIWTPIFFGLRRLRLGLAINILMVTTLAFGVMPKYYQIQPLAAYLLVPYLLWIIFATALNGAICRRNPTSQGYNDAMFQADRTSMKKKAANDEDPTVGL